MSQWAIGIDLGGTAIKAGIVEKGGAIFADRRIPTNATSGPKGITEQLVAIIVGLYNVGITTLDFNDFNGVGVGAPGAVDVDKGLLSYPTNLPGWTIFPLRDELQKCLKAKRGLSIQVFLDNDANVAALGEAVYGAGQGFRDFFMLTLGTGVGGGIILNRQLYHGVYGNAGEVGLMNLDFDGTFFHEGKGTLESLVGKKGIVALARKMIDSSSISSSICEYCNNDYTMLSPRHLEQAALNGDQVALQLWQSIGSIIGVALANVTGLMDIRKFIIGGGVSAANGFFMESVIEQFRQSILPTMQEGLEIVPAQLGNKAGMYGAATLCFG